MTSPIFDWIKEETFEQIVDSCFRTSIQKIQQDRAAVKTEPTLVIALSSLLDIPVESVMETQKTYGLVKTLQNAIGAFHQAVLGSAEGWEDSGSSGGVFDIYSTQPVQLAGKRMVVAEVKMRYNTIKASDECIIFDKLKDASSSRGGAKKCVSYLVQIVPKTDVSYDRPWKVSGRVEIENVRCIDGRSAYHMVTGSPSAFDDVMLALPTYLRRSFEKHTSQPHIDWTTSLPEAIIQTAVDYSIPRKSTFEPSDNK